MPSCRSRSSRRRVWSAAATIRARDADSSARLWVFAMAVPQQLGELGETIPCVIGDRLVRGRDRHQSPDGAVDDDRGARNAVQPERARRGGEGASPVRTFLGPGRAPRLPRACGKPGRVERPAGARLEGMRPVTPGGEHGHRLVVIVVALDRGNGQVHHPGHLAGDGGEYLAGLRAPGYQRDHAAQRGLLVCQPLGHGRASLRRDHDAPAQIGDGDLAARRHMRDLPRWPPYSPGSRQLLNGDRRRSDAPAGGVAYGVGDGGWQADDTFRRPYRPFAQGESQGPRRGVSHFGPGKHLHGLLPGEGHDTTPTYGFWLRPRATRVLVAALLRTGQAQPVAQRVQQRDSVLCLSPRPRGDLGRSRGWERRRPR